MVDHYLITKYFREAFNIITTPGIVHFAVAAKFVRHQVMVRLNTYYLETVGLQFYKHFSAYLFLRIGKECFHITHNWVVELSFMQPVTVEH